MLNQRSHSGVVMISLLIRPSRRARCASVNRCLIREAGIIPSGGGQVTDRDTSVKFADKPPSGTKYEARNCVCWWVDHSTTGRACPAQPVVSNQQRISPVRVALQTAAGSSRYSCVVSGVCRNNVSLPASIVRSPGHTDIGPPFSYSAASASIIASCAPAAGCERH